MSSTKKLAARHNKGKLEWHNFPLFLVRPLMQIAHFGATKYKTYNFLKGAPQSQYFNSAMRHLDSYMDPTQPDNDPESGISHAAHAAWNLLVMAYMLKKRPELDNRYKEEE